MFKREAAWLQRQMSDLPTEGLDPLLSLGSGGANIRDDKQPWISQRVYAPLLQRGVRIVHHEFAPGPGIEVVGDLSDTAFLDGLVKLETRAVICCNVLEHLADREPLLNALRALVAPGANLILTVPCHFPYHADPIDTMYRPTVADLCAALPEFTLVSGEEVATGTLWKYLWESPDARASVLNGFRNAVRRRSRVPGPAGAAASGEPGRSGAARYFLRTTSVTCAVFRRDLDQ